MTWNPIDEVREWHCATNKKACVEMEERFKKEGLRIHLVDILETGDRNLKVACIFDGPDADPHAERFKSYQDLD